MKNIEIQERYNSLKIEIFDSKKAEALLNVLSTCPSDYKPHEAEMVNDLINSLKTYISATNGYSIKIIKYNELSYIASVICSFYSVSLEELRNISRSPKLVRPRHVYFYIAKKISGQSAKGIGLYLNKHHTTVINGIAQIEDRIDLFGETLKYEIDEIRSIIENKTEVMAS